METWLKLHKPTELYLTYFFSHAISNDRNESEWRSLSGFRKKPNSITMMFVGNLWNAVEVNSKMNEKEKIPILVAPSLSNF